MTTVSLARELFANVKEFANHVLDGLPDDALTWRPDPDANTIAWLVWHTARGQDSQIAHLGNHRQVWHEEGWAERFGLAPDDDGNGYGDTTEEVGRIPGEPVALRAYLEAVTDRTLRFLDDAADDDWDRIVDTRWDPPVTARVRLASIVSDDLMHVGQAAYVRGLHERR